MKLTLRVGELALLHCEIKSGERIELVELQGLRTPLEHLQPITVEVTP